MGSHPIKRIIELDGLRGIACLMVLGMHYFAVFDLGSDVMQAIYQFLGVSAGGHGPGGGSVPWITMLSASGVDLFFVLSGFLISGILFDNSDSPTYFRTFYIRRICRIFPVYYLVFLSLLVALLLVDLVPAMKLWLLRDLLPLWSYGTFTQTFFMALDPSTNGGGRWIGISWSVAVEEHFYLLFPFVVRYASRATVRDLALLSLIGAPVLRVLAAKAGIWYYPLLPCRIDCLAVGVLAAYALREPNVWAWLRQNRERIYAGMAICAVGFIFFHDHMLGYSWIALLFGCVLLLVVVHPETLVASVCRWKILCNVGMVSYGVYMYHQAVNGTFHALVFQAEPTILDWGTLSLTLLSVVVTAVLAAVSYHAMEKHLLRLGHKATWQPEEKPKIPSTLANAA